MTQLNQQLIQAVARKAEVCCPGSLALIGVYGSVATGDTHKRSDLDLLILINDRRGRVLSHAFILEDAEIGYDLYCTDWAALESDALCTHPYLAKLLDSRIVHVADPSAPARLEALRTKAKDLLASPLILQNAIAAFDRAKICFSDCMLSCSLDSCRSVAGEAVSHVLSAIMLYNGRYFKKGVKRCFEELPSLPFDAEKLIRAVISAETPESIKACLFSLMTAVAGYLKPSKPSLSPGDIAGSYEEMYSNWRGKMYEAAEKEDLYSCFMSLGAFSAMLRDVCCLTGTPAPDIMGGFSPFDLSANAELFEGVLAGQLAEYRKAGISPRVYSGVEDFIKSYLG